jgi:hypothetical protein
MDSVKITNIQPNDITSIQVHIPPNTPFYTQNFGNMLSLDPKQFNYISRASVIVDTAGIYNIQKKEIFTMRAPGPGNEINVVFEPGNYTIEGVLKLINSQATADKPFVSIDRTGANAYKTILNFWGDNVTGQLAIQIWVFERAPTLQAILGLKLQAYPLINSFVCNYLNGPHPPTDPPTIRQGYILDFYSQNYIAPWIVDFTAGFDTIFVASDLIKQSTLIGPNYLITAAINVKPGEILVYTQRCNIPLSKTNFSSIDWKLTNRLGLPYTVQTPVDIFLEILSQDK